MCIRDSISNPLNAISRTWDDRTIIILYIPVSYTHLDVYKRQTLLYRWQRISLTSSIYLTSSQLGRHFGFLPFVFPTRPFWYSPIIIHSHSMDTWLWVSSGSYTFTLFDHWHDNYISVISHLPLPIWRPRYPLRNFLSNNFRLSSALWGSI